MGKGDTRRPTLVSDQMAAERHCATFGHNPGPEGRVCLTCGTRLGPPAKVDQ